MKNDAFFMQEALKEAEKAAAVAEVPVGAILVHGGQIIARAHNQVEMLQDATAHAEMLVMTMGASYLGNWRLLDAILYTTLEPCSMCAGAMQLSRVSKVIYGAKDVRMGAAGSVHHLLDNAQGGILEDACSRLLKDFFQKRRQSESFR